ncbi:MAG: hypothetical protein OEV52_03495 [Dehalococcoidia bacterium]|nr:hypothetical protein [Dehalococcoidia bacterium]
MASNGSGRSGLLTAGGVLSIVGGALQVIGGLIVAILTVGIGLLIRLAPIPFPPGDWGGHVVPCVPFWLIIVGVPLFALGIVAIVGGVSAIRRGRFGLSLAGAICALPSVPLGILAVIFVSVSKREFEAKE